MLKDISDGVFSSLVLHVLDDFGVFGAEHAIINAIG